MKHILRVEQFEIQIMKHVFLNKHVIAAGKPNRQGKSWQSTFLENQR